MMRTRSAVKCVVLVIRQYVLNRERDVLLATATASAEHAQEATQEANRAADASTASLVAAVTAFLREQ